MNENCWFNAKPHQANTIAEYIWALSVNAYFTNSLDEGVNKSYLFVHRTVQHCSHELWLSSWVVFYTCFSLAADVFGSHICQWCMIPNTSNVWTVNTTQKMQFLLLSENIWMLIIILCLFHPIHFCWLTTITVYLEPLQSGWSHRLIYFTTFGN